LQWGARVAQEFHDQWEAEEIDSLGPSTSFFKYNGKSNFFKSQASFLKSVVLPLWEDIHIFMPEIDELVMNIKNNIELFYQLS